MADRRVKKSEKIVPGEGRSIGKSIDAVLRTDEGKDLFAHLANVCGFFVTSLTHKRSDGEVAVLTTECKEAQRLVYLDLRKLASRGLLAEAEALAEDPKPEPVVADKIPEEERK